VAADSRSLFTGGGGLAFDARRACRTLGRADPALAGFMRRVGPLRLRADSFSSPYEALLESIVYQQITGAAAASILARVRSLGGGALPPPEAVRAMTLHRLRGAGLTRAKAEAIRDLAARVLDGTVPPLRTLRRLDDEQIVDRLTSIRGIGRWTAEMLLIFRLGRPDVLPATDYAIRKAAQRVWRLRPLPAPREVLARGEAWRPYRSAASWYLWRVIEWDLR
jgi:DNA-3-methyladenine glycosylase II